MSIWIGFITKQICTASDNCMKVSICLVNISYKAFFHGPKRALDIYYTIFLLVYVFHKMSDSKYSRYVVARSFLEASIKISVLKKLAFFMWHKEFYFFNAYYFGKL